MKSERSEIGQLKAQANMLRKASRFEEALSIYKALWEETHDAFDGAGFLSCLRKLRRYDQALPLAAELFREHPDSEWARREVAWTLIQGRLLLAREDTPLAEVTGAAQSVMETVPDFLAKKVAVFAVLRHAKRHNNWTCVAEWIDLLDPLNLSDTPLKKEGRVEDWTEQERWYNYKINCCIENNNATAALEICHSVEDKYPRHSKFFARLCALALKALGRPEESVAVYRRLCSGERVDWWLLHEYGSMLSETGERQKGLLLLCKAAMSCPKPALGVRLYQEIGNLLFASQNKQSAFIHYSLAAAVRKADGWPIPPELQFSIRSLETEAGLQGGSQRTAELLKSCREIWLKLLSDQTDRSDRRQRREGLKGRISIVCGRKACFINCKDGLSAICMNDEVPPSITDGEIVRFDAVPSFDKKKNRESWRARNVQKNV